MSYSFSILIGNYFQFLFIPSFIFYSSSNFINEELLLQGFRIELFVHSEDGEDPSSSERFAISYALPSTMPGTFGIASLPLLAKSNRPVGQIMGNFYF